MEENLDALLEKAKALHGDICSGIVMGTRITIAGMRALGMDPMERNRDLIVFVEIDRCMSDAVQAITGCTLGHRTLKYLDYGRFAAIFYDSASRKAVRVASRRRSNTDRSVDLRPIYKAMPQEELLTVEEIDMALDENQLPGFPQVIEECSRCGELVFDNRHVVIKGEILCRACAEDIQYHYVPEGEAGQECGGEDEPD